MGKVRNCLTHNGGLISENYIKDISSIKKIVKIEEEASDYWIYVDFKDCKELLNLVSKYFKVCRSA
jgi:hypothetical protein